MVEGVVGGVHEVEEPKVLGVVPLATDDAQHEVIGGGAQGEGGEVGGEVVEELEGFWGFLVQLLQDVEDFFQGFSKLDWDCVLGWWKERSKVKVHIEKVYSCNLGVNLRRK